MIAFSFETILPDIKYGDSMNALVTFTKDGITIVGDGRLEFNWHRDPSKSPDPKGPEFAGHWERDDAQWSGTYGGFFSWLSHDNVVYPADAPDAFARLHEDYRCGKLDANGCKGVLEAIFRAISDINELPSVRRFQDFSNGLGLAELD